MNNLVKKFLKRVFNKAGKHRNDDYYHRNLLKTGRDSDISGLHIEIFHNEADQWNVEIGNDCLLMGSITVYSKNAKVKIGDKVFIGPGTKLICYDDIEIESNVMISWGCTIMDTNSHSLKSHERLNDVIDWKKGWKYKNWSVVENKKIHIESNSWIGFDCVILKGIRIAKGSIVAAASVVTRDTEPFTIVGGNPATFIKKTE